MFDPNNNPKNTLTDPNPNSGPYATEMWPIGTQLEESGNKYVFCKTMAVIVHIQLVWKHNVL